MSAVAGETTYKPPASHYYCTSNPAPNTRYYSGLFDAPASPQIENQNAKAFRQFLSTKYGINAPASCQGNPDKNAEQAQMQQQITQLKSVKWKIVETGWMPAGVQASAGANDTSHPDCKSADGWKSVAEYKAACENQSQSGDSTGQLAVTGQDSSASAGYGGTMGANSGLQSSATSSAAGTTLAVRLLQAVDSAKDGPGRQYRAVITKPATGGNGFSVPQGSIAVVLLFQNQSGWAAHLQSLTIQGKPINVSSGPASVMNSAQSTAAGAMNTVNSALSNFGFHRNNHAPAVEAVATGQRVVLPPGTQLQFVLNSASPAGATGFGDATNVGGMSQPANANSIGISNTTAAASGGALNAKISEVALGPAPSKIGGKYVVSPDGGHYAAFAMHGSRELIIIDGVKGPEFDHAGHASGGIDVVFNKDGIHSAYIGQSGDSLVAVVDNKQRATIQQIRAGSGVGELQGMNTDLNYPPTVSNQAPNQLHPILLSPSGLHYACIASDYTKNVSNMVLDGVKGPDMMSIDRDQIAFVNEQLVYVGITPDRNAHIVVNNKPGPEYGTVQSMLVTPDARHYAVMVTTKGGRMVVVDGKPGTLRHFEGNGIHDMVMASNGRVAFVGDLPLGGGISHIVQALYVDDHEISHDIRPFATAVYGNHIQNYAVFSPDGTKFAYAKVVPGGMAAVIDGKVGRTYDALGLTGFSPDSKHAFSVGVRGQSFVTVDGREMPGINRLDNFVFSNDGTRFAYEAYSQDGNHVVVDGKESPRYYNIIARSLSFSLDSKHYIYGACTNIMKCEVVLDGNVTNVPALSEFSARTLRPVYIFPPAFFSPDGSRVAYAYSKSDGTSQTVYFVNGKEMVHGTSFEFPSFSPDSKHFVVMGWNGHGYSFFADGKMGPGYQELLEANLNIARFEKPETYRFLGIKNDSVYRVTVDLASMN